MKHILLILLCSAQVLSQQCLPLTWDQDQHDCGDGNVVSIDSMGTLITQSDNEGKDCSPCEGATSSLCGDVTTNQMIGSLDVSNFEYIELTYKITGSGDLDLTVLT